MKALHSWLLTEGAHGMISQTEGLAKSLNTTFDHQTIELPSIFKLLPPKLTPKIKLSFNFDKIIRDIKIVPDIIISCGRKSVIPNIVLKKYFKQNFNRDVKNIHIQDPKISHNNFDFIIAPAHDNKIKSKNLIQSTGAIHYLNEEEVSSNNNGENIITFILGGPNKYYKFLNEELDAHFKRVNSFTDIKKINVIASRRTPAKVFDSLKSKFNSPLFYYDITLDKKNYTNALAEASHIIVTCDSTSMISEAAITGKPIYIAHLNNHRDDYRFKRFVKTFKDLGIVKDFDGNLQHWTYEKLYESKRVAKIILERMN